MVSPVIIRRRALRATGSVTGEVPFVADPSPLGGQVGPWAQRQFEAVQRALLAERAARLALEERLAKVEAIAGDGTWDGGTP